MKEDKTAHSILSPSKAVQWSNCPASLLMCKDIPEKSNKYADEGTKAHELAAELFAFSKIKNEENYSVEMINHVKNYVEKVQYISQGAEVIECEMEIDLSMIYGIPGEKGTADYIAIVPIEQGSTIYELQIHDLKYGMKKVEAKDNLQLLIYAIGAYEKYSIVYEITHIHLYIHQPRAYNYPDHRYTAKELVEWDKKIVKQGIVAYRLYIGKLQLQDCHFVPGEKQCQYCGHNVHCKALSNCVKKIVFDDFDEIDMAKTEKKIKTIWQNPNVFISFLSENMKYVSLIRMWCNVVEECITNELLEGREVPGWKLIQGRAKPGKWVDIDKLQQYIADRRLTKTLIEKKIVSPSQAKKLLPEKKWIDISKHVMYSDPNPMLVSEDAKGTLWMPKNTEEMKVIEQKGGNNFIEDSLY